MTHNKNYEKKEAAIMDFIEEMKFDIIEDIAKVCEMFQSEYIYETFCEDGEFEVKEISEESDGVFMVTAKGKVVVGQLVNTPDGPWPDSYTKNIEFDFVILMKEGAMEYRIDSKEYRLAQSCNWDIYE